MAGVSLQSVEKPRGGDKGLQSLIFNPSLATQGELSRRGKRSPLGGVCSRKYETPEDIILCRFCRPEACRNW